MLIDDVDITVQAGHGGAGKVSFGGDGPDGGNGGKGGDVYITVTSDLKALNQFSAKNTVSATDGETGMGKRSFGKKGQDVTVVLPLGSTLTEKETGETVELDRLDLKILICKGGIGGRGNLEFKSSKNRSPDYAQPGRPGQVKNFKVILRFIADFGLIGLPNAGKSSLLNELTNAKAATAAYPFTTLEANLGVFGSKIIADIPGLIAGASEGRGLGTDFLKHIEKVKMLLHCIAADSADLIADFNTINHELEEFNPELLNKKRLILLTKSDLVEKSVLTAEVKKLKTLKYEVIPVSVYDLPSIENLKSHLS
jgi:GTP-binding protein